MCDGAVAKSGVWFGRELNKDCSASDERSPQFKNSSTILLPRDVPSKSTNPTNTHAERQSTNRNGFDDDEDGCDDVRLCQSVRDYIILILYCEWVRVCVCWLCVFGFIYENVFVNPLCRTQDGRSGSNFASHSVQEF